MKLTKIHFIACSSFIVQLYPCDDWEQTGFLFQYGEKNRMDVDCAASPRQVAISCWLSRSSYSGDESEENYCLFEQEDRPELVVKPSNREKKRRRHFAYIKEDQSFR